MAPRNPQKKKSVRRTERSIPLKEFEDVLLSALKSLPPPSLSRKIENTAILIEDKRKPASLLGLYEGVPLTEQSTAPDSAPSFPDRIILFKRNLEELCGGDRKRLRREIRKTLLREIAHHFGLEDSRLDELGLG